MQTMGSSGVKPKSGAAKTAARKSSRATEKSKDTLHLKSKADAQLPSREELYGMIATAAYFCAEQRSFEPGHELEDWLIAEQQVKAQLPSYSAP